jgi:tyrosyl-tRNA synthetase
MSDKKMTLSEELTWRGFINQHTFKDIKELDKNKFIFYHGFDATADSQTIGNLAAMMIDRIFLRHGHKAVILAGGATSLIGDPGGKENERSLQDETTIKNNVNKANQQFKNIYRDYNYVLVNNIDWLKDLRLIEFLRDVGKHFSMTPLVQRDYIAKRLGNEGAGISYAEFSYTILQGYDYLHLYNKYSVNLQIGGSDQWGNCLSGVDLIRRKCGAEVHALTLPLVINKATGKKFGKSEAGAIWLDSNKTSVYTFYQFWLNTDDQSVLDYLKIFTSLNYDEVETIMEDFHHNKSARSAQKRLAFEVTKIVHGEDEAKNIARISEILFDSSDYQRLSKNDFSKLVSALGQIKVNSGIDIAECLVQSLLASSRSDARRLLDSNSVYINGHQIALNKLTLDDGDSINGFCLLRVGKNKQVVVNFSK